MNDSKQLNDRDGEWRELCCVCMYVCECVARGNNSVGVTDTLKGE